MVLHKEQGLKGAMIACLETVSPCARPQANRKVGEAKIGVFQEPQRSVHKKYMSSGRWENPYLQQGVVAW
jgi:hypothetical protein